MNRPDLPPNWPQQVADYFDGKLDPAARRQVAKWLNVPAPTEATWAKMWNRIDSAMDAPSPQLVRRGPWWRRGLFAAALILPAATAAAAVVLLIVQPTAPLAPIATPAEEYDEVFIVAAAGDVEIHSVRDADADQLVVGEAPFKHPMNLVVAGEVRLDELLPAADGMLPEVQLGGWTDAPLIYAPATRNP